MIIDWGPLLLDILGLPVPGWPRPKSSPYPVVIARIPLPSFSLAFSTSNSFYFLIEILLCLFWSRWLLLGILASLLIFGLESDFNRGFFFLTTGLLSAAILSISTGFGGLPSSLTSAVDALAFSASWAGVYFLLLLTINPVYGLGSLFLYSIAVTSFLGFWSTDFSL